MWMEGWGVGLFFCLPVGGCIFGGGKGWAHGVQVCAFLLLSYFLICLNLFFLFVCVFGCCCVFFVCFFFWGGGGGGGVGEQGGVCVLFFSLTAGFCFQVIESPGSIRTGHVIENKKRDV